MYTEHPTPQGLAIALRPLFPDAHVEAEQFTKLSTPDFEIAVWIREPFELLQMRAVVARRDELKGITEQDCSNLAANLNGSYLFGRFNAASPLGLSYDYEIPYAPSLTQELVAKSIELIGRGARSARQTYVARALKRAEK